jgi:hypothetical protein
MAYVYKGTQRDLEPVEPYIPRKGKPGPKPKPLVFDPSKCGSQKGYKQHRRHGQEACDPCKAGNAAYHREWTKARQVPKAERPVGVYDPEFCGSHKGYNRHQRRNTTPCTPCRAGHNEHMREYKASRKAAA